ncbi:MAG: rhomboid family intramembrane serine protease [Rhizobiales bacterium]|nr:rhomboid family intramembrane serine protease [Hyphomicrobiales bacterium]
MSQFANDVEEPERGRGPVFQSPPVVLAVIAGLALIHAVLEYAGWQVWSFENFAFISRSSGQIWRFLTYALLHADWMHLIFNCLWLLIFGTVVARYLGAGRFLLLCGASAIGGAAVTLLLHWNEDYRMIGASGAVSGLMAAAVPIMYGRGRLMAGWPAGDPQTARPLTPGQLLRNRNALIFTLVWLVITLMSGATGFTGNSFMAEGGIAWEAHIGGFAAGLAGFYLLQGGVVRSR